MSVRSVAILESVLLLTAISTFAASRSDLTRITVLASETRAMPLQDNGVPNNCDQVTFDAYCRAGRKTPLLNTLLVQIGQEPPFRISCSTESQSSPCVPLPKDASFEARREKKGITVYYVDDRGKERKQLYTLVNGGGAAPPAPTNPLVPAQNQNAAAPKATQPTADVSANVKANANANGNRDRYASAAAPVVQNSAQPASAPGPGWVKATDSQKVRCTFNSTPSGAEITVDGRYAGNTPSQIGLSAGAHVVVLSMAGFAPWKREVTVASDSVISVTATLQKVEP